MKLAFKKLGQGEPLLILHGLFGSGDNWISLGKRWAEQFEVYLIDQRNHGRSTHSAEHNYPALAADLESFCADHGLGRVWVLGHSMGGKTAMYFAQKYPSRLKGMVVVDMGVKSYPPHHQEVLNAFKAVDLSSVESRTDAEQAVAAHISDPGVQQFILKSLYRTPEGQYHWRVNFKVLEAEMSEILAPVPSVAVRVPNIFIRGTRSNYILPEDYPEIRKIFPEAEFAELPTGHWVHAEDPDGLFELVNHFVTLHR